MNDLPLRERKYAATKAVLMDALVTRLGGQSLGDIAVKDVCREAQVSETTFFNYFPSKQAVIGYRVQLWSLEIQWAMQQHLAAGGAHLDAVRLIFESVASGEERAPGIMREILIYQTREAMSFVPLTPAEYVYHFPNQPEIAQLEIQGIDQLFPQQLGAAQAAGELPSTVDLLALSFALIGVFFITPVLLAKGNYGTIRDAYRRQLDLLFRP